MIAQIETVVESATQLAGHNDRVLFLVTLLLFFVAGGVAVKWFMAQLDKRDESIKEIEKERREETARLYKEIGQVREQFNAYLMAAAQELRASLSHNSEVIAQNSKVIAENTEMSQRKLTILDTIERLLEQKGLN